MGKRRWVQTFEHDPDEGCEGCPWEKGPREPWCGHPGEAEDLTYAEYETCAPDWCPLRALPDTEGGQHA